MMASKAAVSGMGWKLHTGSVAYSIVFTYKYVSSIGEKSKAISYRKEARPGRAGRKGGRGHVLHLITMERAQKVPNLEMLFALIEALEMQASTFIQIMEAQHARSHP